VQHCLTNERAGKGHTIPQQLVQWHVPHDETLGKKCCNHLNVQSQHSLLISGHYHFGLLWHRCLKKKLKSYVIMVT